MALLAEVEGKEAGQDFLKQNAELPFGDLREKILRETSDPLDWQLVRRLNGAEIEFWRALSNLPPSADLSYKKVTFDCGGKQSVREMAFRTGDGRNELDLAREALKLIEDKKVGFRRSYTRTFLNLL